MEERVSGGGGGGEEEEQVEVQQMWKDMESRVTRRRMRTLAEAGEKVGRRNVRKTDEEMRLAAGFYMKDGETGGEGGEEGGGEGGGGR